MRKLHDGRLQLPDEVPYTEAHNTWVANKPGSQLVIPVGELPNTSSKAELTA